MLTGPSFARREAKSGSRASRSIALVLVSLGGDCVGEGWRWAAGCMGEDVWGYELEVRGGDCVDAMGGAGYAEDGEEAEGLWEVDGALLRIEDVEGY